MKLSTIPDLITYGEFKSGFSNDLLLRYLIGTSKKFERFMNRTLQYEEDGVEYQTSTNTRIFFLSRYPIDLTKDFTVEVNEYGTWNELTVDEDYWITETSGRVEFLEPVLTYEPKNVKFTYSGGFPEISYNATATTWADSTAYTVNDRIKVVGATPTGDSYFRCTTAGTSGMAEPTWDTTINSVTADGATLEWTEDSYYAGVLDLTNYEDLLDAFLAQVSYEVQKRKFKGSSSFTTPDGSQSLYLYKQKLLPDVRLTLVNYKRPATVR